MNKIAIITGASGGIGQAIALRLHNEGYQLVLNGRDQGKLTQFVRSLAGQHKVIPADLTLREDRERLLREAFQWGSVDLLVNSAGISNFNDFTSIPEDDIEKLININLMAPIYLTQRFIGMSKKTHATTIINVGSTFGSIGFPCFSVYCASKFALRGLTEALAREFDSSNVRIAYFAPRTTKTNINTQQVNEMNHALGTRIDSVEAVANQFMTLLYSRKRRYLVGWPERFFARLNGVIPEIIDKALISKVKTIKRFTIRNAGEAR